MGFFTKLFRNMEINSLWSYRNKLFKIDPRKIKCTQLSERATNSFTNFLNKNSLKITNSPNNNAFIFRGMPLERALSGGGKNILFRDQIDIIKNFGNKPFDMPKYIKGERVKISQHVQGNTSMNSFSENPNIAGNFGASKTSNGASCIDCYDNAGSKLSADLVSSAQYIKNPGDEFDPSYNLHMDTIYGHAYQKEHGAYFMPMSRHVSTKFMYSEDNYLSADLGVREIYNPLHIPFNEILLNNEDPKLINRVHEYEQQALNASIDFSENYHNIMNNKFNCTQSLLDKFMNSYENLCQVEESFRQDLKDNYSLDVPQIDVKQSMQSFIKAGCAASGQYTNNNGENFSLEVNENGDFSMQLPGLNNELVTKTISQEELLTMCPANYMAAFNLISSDGGLKIKQLPPSMNQIFSTACITKLKESKNNNIDWSKVNYKVPLQQEILQAYENQNINSDRHIESNKKIVIQKGEVSPPDNFLSSSTLMLLTFKEKDMFKECEKPKINIEESTEVNPNIVNKDSSNKNDSSGVSVNKLNKATLKAVTRNDDNQQNECPSFRLN